MIFGQIVQNDVGFLLIRHSGTIEVKAQGYERSKVRLEHDLFMEMRLVN